MKKSQRVWKVVLGATLVLVMASPAAAQFRDLVFHVPNGANALVILNVGLDLGVLTPALFSLLVLMAFVTTLMTSPLLSALGLAARPRPLAAVRRTALCFDGDAPMQLAQLASLPMKNDLLFFGYSDRAAGRIVLVTLGGSPKSGATVAVQSQSFAHLFATAQHDFYTATHMVNVGTWMTSLAVDHCYRRTAVFC